MSRQDKIFDDIARIAGGAAGVLSAASRQMNENIRTLLDDWAQKMDLVPREDFERLEVMLTKAREEQNSLSRRVEALEKKLSSRPVKLKPDTKKAVRKKQ